jgi:transposase
METANVRVRRTVVEKRRIVELTLLPGASVARVARAEGVNSHQVFQWRRAYRAGKLEEFGEHTSSLLPVIVSAAGSAGVVEQQQTVCPKTSSPLGAIHIELPGCATISVESGADAATLPSVLESLRK